MSTLYHIMRWVDGEPRVMADPAGGPLTFFEPIVPRAIAKGINAAGGRAEVIEIDPRCETLEIPLDNFGLSRRDESPAPQGLLGLLTENEPQKMTVWGCLA